MIPCASLHPPSEVLIERALRSLHSFEADDDSSLGSTSPPNSPSREHSQDGNQSYNRSTTLFTSRLRHLHSELVPTPPRRLGDLVMALPTHGIDSSNNNTTANRPKTGLDDNSTGNYIDRNIIHVNMPCHQLSDEVNDEMPPSVSPRRRYIRSDCCEEKKSSTPPPNHTFTKLGRSPTASLLFEDEGDGEVMQTLVGRHSQSTSKMTPHSDDGSERSSLDGQPTGSSLTVHQQAQIARNMADNDATLCDRGDIPMLNHEDVSRRSRNGDSLCAMPTDEGMATSDKELIGNASKEHIDIVSSRSHATLRSISQHVRRETYGRASSRLAKTDQCHTKLMTEQALPENQEVPKTCNLDTGIVSEKEWAGLLRHTRTRKPDPEQESPLEEQHCIQTEPVKSLDLDIGIPKGDIMLSLLNDGCPNREWVKDGIWRMRRMRRNCDSTWARTSDEQTLNLSEDASMLEADANRSKGSIAQIQAEAFQQLRRDKFDQAQLLYEDILHICHRNQEYHLRNKGSCSEAEVEKYIAESKSYIGTLMHNLGLILLMQGKWQDAFAYLERATWNRSYGAWGSSCHVSSLTRTALARHALDDVQGSIATLEEALPLAKANTSLLSDHHMLAEILNNLGCLSFLTGNADCALQYFNDSLQIQKQAADHSLYVGSKLSYHQEMFNMSITRANIGFLHLVVKDASKCIAMFESAIKAQQLLLRDADATLISTMEHLVTAHLLVGNKTKAIQLLNRMLRIQCDARGPSHSLARSTANKISMLQTGAAAGLGERLTL
ncbi:hypothetical protein MPSEU_001002900 [Mayamaea pseudoterrestris]|nr:hypothetical protein MPSEU_001002900 [Mayamaea pseudoterrestris]